MVVTGDHMPQLHNLSFRLLLFLRKLYFLNILMENCSHFNDVTACLIEAVFLEFEFMQLMTHVLECRGPQRSDRAV